MRVCVGGRGWTGKSFKSGVTEDHKTRRYSLCSGKNLSRATSFTPLFPSSPLYSESLAPSPPSSHTNYKLSSHSSHFLIWPISWSLFFYFIYSLIITLSPTRPLIILHTLHYTGTQEHEGGGGGERKSKTEDSSSSSIRSDFTKAECALSKSVLGS